MASDSGSNSGLSALPIGQIVGAISNLAGALLAQHTLRLHDAANENAALDALIPAFDADLAEIVQAYNSGTEPQSCINALLAVDSNAYTYLRAQVGKPGTAWGGPSTASIGTSINPSYPATCDKSCTAGCCVYLNDLRPAIFGRQVGNAYGPYQNKPGIVGGLIEAIQNGSGTIHVIPIAKPPNTAYGNYARASYDLTVKKPPFVGLDSAVLQSVGSGANFTITSNPQVEGSQVGGSIVPFLSSVKGVSTTTILAVVGGLIIVITALFGQNALRVNR